MFMNPFRKKDTPELDPQLAGQMLQNVFDICETESNSVPLDVLTSYANYRKERFSLQKGLLVVIMILFCMLPVLFIAPTFTVEETGDAEYNPVYTVDVNTVLPISYVAAVIDGRNVPIYDAGGGTYTVEPTANGTMTITVSLFNRQFTSEIIEVATVDKTFPTVVSDRIKNGEVYLYLSDRESGVDYDGVYAADSGGKQVLPVSRNEKEGYIVFRYPETSLNIYIPDHAGNTLHLILTV